MEKILTVVIPTYNGEKYVERAVRSILGQPAGSSLKVLLVNDGSTDSSGAICDELAHGHENVSVIHKPNGGVSSARNMGIDRVETKYVAFLDCDDWWNDGFFDEDLLAELSGEASCDIYQFAFQQVDASCRMKCVHPVQEGLLRYEENGLGRYDWAHHCSFMMRTALLRENGVRYPACKIVEDGPFVEMALYCARSVRRINRIIFCYWQNQNSVSHNAYVMDAILEEHKGALQRKEFFKAWGVKVDVESELVWSVANNLPKLCAAYGFQELRSFMDVNCLGILARRPDIRFGEKMWGRLEAYRRNPWLCWMKYRIVPGIPLAMLSAAKRMPRVYRMVDDVLNRVRRGYTSL